MVGSLARALAEVREGARRQGPVRRIAAGRRAPVDVPWRKTREVTWSTIIP